MKWRQGDTEGALAAFREGLELDPHRPALLNNLAALYIEQGRRAEARAALAAASTRDASPYLFVVQGDLELVGGNLKEALKAYRRAHREEPKLVEPLLGIARAEKALGNDAAARRALRKAEKLRPDDRAGPLAPRGDLSGRRRVPERAPARVRWGIVPRMRRFRRTPPERTTRMRKLRLLATLVPLVALAFPAAAQLEKFKDWDKSPEFTYYATDDEQKAWKAVKTDDEAEKFYNLFWGRRHPDYQKTAQNVFRLALRRPRREGGRALRARDQGRQELPAGGSDRARKGPHRPRAAEVDGQRGDCPAGDGRGRRRRGGRRQIPRCGRRQRRSSPVPVREGAASRVDRSEDARPEVHDGPDGADRIRRQAGGREAPREEGGRGGPRQSEHDRAARLQDA